MPSVSGERSRVSTHACSLSMLRVQCRNASEDGSLPSATTDESIQANRKIQGTHPQLFSRPSVEPGCCFESSLRFQGVNWSKAKHHSLAVSPWVPKPMLTRAADSLPKCFPERILLDVCSGRETPSMAVELAGLAALTYCWIR